MSGKSDGLDEDLIGVVVSLSAPPPRCRFRVALGLLDERARRTVLHLLQTGEHDGRRVARTAVMRVVTERTGVDVSDGSFVQRHTGPVSQWLCKSCRAELGDG